VHLWIARTVTAIYMLVFVVAVWSIGEGVGSVCVLELLAKILADLK